MDFPGIPLKQQTAKVVIVTFIAGNHRIRLRFQKRSYNCMLAMGATRFI